MKRETRNAKRVQGYSPFYTHIQIVTDRGIHTSYPPLSDEHHAIMSWQHESPFIKEVFSTHPLHTVMAR